MSTVRHLAIDLDTLEGDRPVEPRPWRCPDGALSAVGEWGGTAAALVQAACGDTGLQLALGPGIAGGLPTAGRASVFGRSPLTGRLAEGQVGSDLGLRLFLHADLVTLRGRARAAGSVLVIQDGRAHLTSIPDLRGASPEETHARLEQLLGPCTSLRIGPAGEAGVDFANLAAGSDPASYVGRGGLGRVLADHGLKAIAVLGEPQPMEPQGEFARRLADSPRLVARAVGGTFELAHARVAQGNLDPDVGAELAATLAERRTGRHGCRACPTPCGWTFEVPDGPKARQGARFSAVHALGSDLGLAADDALALLARCNHLGLDAKEVGAGLALAIQTGRAVHGERASFEALLERIGRGELLARGAARYASEHGLDDPTAGGEAVRAESDLGVLLGVCAAVRGAEPMRSSSFMAAGCHDPADSHTKGRLVWWHENLSAAVDASGFCAFAAAGALADRVLTLDELAHQLEPGQDGGQLLRRGEVLVALVAQANERWGGARTLPSWAPEALRAPGMWPEYRDLRGLDPEGRLVDAARAGSLLSAPHRPRSAPARSAAATVPVDALAPGQVQLGATGSLASHLGAEPELELLLPSNLLAVLRHAAERWPAAASLLVEGEQLIPAVYRDGQLVDATQLVHAGDRLELVLAIAGG